MKKISILLIIICIISLTAITFVNHFSYNENFDYSEIEKIQYIQYLREYKVKEYSDYEEVKNISQKLQKLRFYSSNEERLQESPTSSINVYYADGSAKKVNISGITALVKNITGDNDTSDENGVIYYINPISIKAIFQ